MLKQIQFFFIMFCCIHNQVQSFHSKQKFDIRCSFETNISRNVEYVNDMLMEIEEALEDVEFFHAIDLFDELSKFIRLFYNQIKNFNDFISINKYEKIYENIAESLVIDVLKLLKDTETNLKRLKKTIKVHTFPLEYHHFFKKHINLIEQFIENFEGPNHKLFNTLRRKIEKDHEEILLRALNRI
jgi:hypothetical protein